MVDSSARRAVESFIDRCRLTLQCITRLEVLSNGYELAQELALFFLPHRPLDERSVLPLRRRGARSLFFLDLALDYRVEVSPITGMYSVAVSRYVYALQDDGRRELLTFHWHPSGRSGFVAPHLHVSAARPITFAMTLRRPETEALQINRAHLPTNIITLEDVVEMLIADPVFAVEPQRADWQRVLQANRAAQTPNEV